MEIPVVGGGGREHAIIGVQNQYTSAVKGVDAFAALSVYNSLVNLLSRLLYASTIITIAAAAYAYAKKG